MRPHPSSVQHSHTATTTDFSTLLDAFHAGPKLRDQERNQFRFKDGSEGDVYRCVLLALADDPPKLSLRYDEIYTRTRTVCVDSAPVGSSINEALTQSRSEKKLSWESRL